MKNKTYKQNDDMKRLQSILAHSGICSRRKAEDIIKAGKVKVDGKIIKEKGFRVDPSKSKIFVEGKPIKSQNMLYFAVNKEKGVITTTKDRHAERMITDYFRKVKERLYPVGRLDKDTTGLILMTNDGDLAFRLSHPSFETAKEYVVKTTKFLSKKDTMKLSNGIFLDEKKTSPCRIKLIRKEGNGALYKVILHEGMKRQIRRMFGSCNSRVMSLKRVRFAGIVLGDLKEGQKRELSKSEVRKLKRIVGVKN